MANLTITAADVALVRADQDGLIPGPAAEVITAGQYVRLNVTTGKIELGNGTTAPEAREGGIALNGAPVAGLAITFLKRGIVSLGNALTADAFDAPIYLSDTDGTLAQGAGTVSRVVGRVVPGWASTAADKLLEVRL